MHRPLPYRLMEAARASLDEDSESIAPESEPLWVDVGSAHFLAHRYVERRNVDLLAGTYVAEPRLPRWTNPEPEALLRYGGTFASLDAMELLIPTAQPTAVVSAEFDRLAEEWSRETATSSKLSETLMHPAYLEIIGLGREALPLILRELERRPNHWLVALRSIAREDPASDATNFGEAVERWLQWGRERGHLP